MHCLLTRLVWTNTILCMHVNVLFASFPSLFFFFGLLLLLTIFVKLCSTSELSSAPASVGLQFNSFRWSHLHWNNLRFCQGSQVHCRLENLHLNERKSFNMAHRKLLLDDRVQTQHASFKNEESQDLLRGPLLCFMQAITQCNLLYLCAVFFSLHSCTLPSMTTFYFPF